MLLLYLSALLCLSLAAAQQPRCQPVSQILPNPERYFELNKDQFPKDIWRVFQGSLSAQCDHLPGFERDPTLCLTDKKGNERCNLCAPSPQAQFFKYPFWAEFNSIKEERGDEYGSEARPDVTHCMRCFAWALPHNASLSGGLEPDPNYDVEKDSVSVSTRIACAKENTESGTAQFRQPDAALLKELDDKLEALGLNSHPCLFFMTTMGREAGQFCDIRDFQSKQRQAADFIAQKEAEIERHAMATPIPGSPHKESVNAHKEALMEIPFGQMHLIQARVSAQPGFEGWSADSVLQLPPEVGRLHYSQIRPSTPDGRYGCAIYEYGMVVASPGQVRTACWLTPMFKNRAARRKYVEVEVGKEDDIKKEAVKAVQDSFKAQNRAAARQCKRLKGQRNPFLTRVCKALCANQERLAAADRADGGCDHWATAGFVPPQAFGGRSTGFQG